jgi:hypothetical protein
MKIPKISSLLGSAVALLAMASLTSTQAAPAFVSSIPTGRVQFENSSVNTSNANFSVVLSDSVSTPLSNVSITLTGKRLVGGVTFMRYGQWPGTLTASSTNTTTLTYYSIGLLKLENNVSYTAVIIAADATSTNTFTTNFDTVKPVFMWDAVDYDYTPTNSDGSFKTDPTTGATNSGQHIDGPTGGSYTKTNAYRGLSASPDDAMNYYGSGSWSYHLYRPLVTNTFGTSGIPSELATDVPRPPFYNQATNGITNYDMCYHVASNYANFTHIYPTAESTYYIFARMSSPNTSQSNSVHVYDQGGLEWGWLGNVNTGGWQTYTWIPLMDPSGAPTYATFPTGWYGFDANNNPQPQRITFKNDTSASQYNVLCYILLQGSLTVPSPQAVVTNFNPSGAYQLQNTNKLTFTVKGGSVVPANVLVKVSMTNLNLTRTVVTTTYVGGSDTNLTFTGNAGNYTVSMPLQSNKMYGITVQATDSSGNDTVAIVRFDTVSPSFLWEAEDWDYNSGLWLTNGGVNAYQDFTNAPTVSITNVDFGSASTSTTLTFPYRYGLETEVSIDPATRINHTNASGYATDYDLGNNTAGNWANYTRLFPSNYSGTTNIGYNIFVRSASATQYSDLASLYIVTSGAGHPNAQQVTQKIGYYGSTAGPDYHTGQFMPVIDPGGNLAIFRGGSSQTLRYTFDGNYGNSDYFILLKADPNVKNKPYITSFTPDGTSLYQPSNTVTFIVNSQAGMSSNGVTINLDGVVISNKLATFGTNQYLLNVSFPIYTNTVHTVIVAVADAYGASTNTNRFAVLNSNDTYKIEAEDYNYGGGSYFDFPFVPNLYAKGKAADAVTNIDFHRGGSGGSFPYRYGEGQGTAGSDIESGFTSGTTNFETEYSAGGTWENYTRTFPVGTYTSFVRAGTPNSGQAMGTLLVVTNGAASTTQGTSLIGTYEATTASTGGWSSYAWFALTNTSGGLAKFTSDGTPMTLRKASGGGDNGDYFVIVKWNSSIPVMPGITQFTPDSSTLYQPSNKVTFLAVSTDTNFAVKNVSITLDGIPVTSPTTTNFTSPLTNGIRFSFPVSVGRTHTAVVSVFDTNGALTNTYRFQTFSKTNAYKIELLDYDFNGGQFISFTNWTANCYTDIVTTNGTVITTNRMGLTNIDYFRGTASYASFPYRYGIVNGSTTDMESEEFSTNSSITEYVASYITGGDWVNCTRDFPVSGPYNVYLRVSTGWTAGIVPGPLLMTVTNGVGTTNQLCYTNGQFASFTNTGSWGGFVWSPLLDSNGNTAQWYNTNTSPITLKFYMNWPTNTSYTENPHFVVFVPADTSTPVITGLYPDGSVQFQSTNKLTFSIASSAGISASNISITINGVAVAFTSSGTSSNLTISLPLSLNSNYTAVIQAIAGNGSGFTKTITFDTWSPSYTWEAEDFDFTTNGSPYQYIDNPQVGLYYNTLSSEGYDFHLYGTNNESFASQKYRSTSSSDNWVSGNWWLGIVFSGDTARTQFTGATTNLNDYDVEYFTSSSWAHYTRHYPAGTYNVLARVREGNGPVPLLLEKATGVLGSSETLTTLGTFYPTNQGSFTGGWQSVLLMDANTNLATVTFDGSNATLRVEASTNSPNPFPVGSMGDSINLNYFALVPANTSTNITLAQPKITAKSSGTTLTLSFASQAGAYYQVVYATSLTNPTWTSVGSKTVGTGSTINITDTIGTTGTRFYRVLVTNQ